MYKYLRTGSVLVCIYICSLVRPKQPSVPCCLQFYQVTFPSYFMPQPPPPPHTEKNTDHYIIGKPLASRLWVSSVGFCLNRTKEIAWHGTQRRPTRVMTRSPMRDKSDDDCLSTCTVQVACNWAALPGQTVQAVLPSFYDGTNHLPFRLWLSWAGRR